MNSILQQIITEMMTSFGNSAFDLLTGKLDFANLVIETQKSFGKTLCQLLGIMLEQQDQVLADSSYRKQFFKIKDMRERHVDTSIGTVSFRRRYYEDVRTNERIFLLDEQIGLEKSSRLSLDLKAKLLENATHMSYHRSAQHGGPARQSSSTVMHVVHEKGKLITALDQLNHEKRQAPMVLFVEADEDHVAHQDGTSHFLKMVYVHEGYDQRCPGRFSIKEPVYVTGEYPGPIGTEELWRTVKDLIDAKYQGEPNQFFLAGDGANWIKAGADFLPNCTLVYDKFHLKKTCQQAAVGIPGNIGLILMQWCLQGERKYLEDYFQVRLSDPQLRMTERKTIQQARTRIRSNWSSIKANTDSSFHGCSAEGHISHVLSERFSSRPMGWSQAGTDSLSQTRVFVMQNGHVLEKLNMVNQKIQKTKRKIRVDDRISVLFKADQEKYASAVNGAFVALKRGQGRMWQRALMRGHGDPWGYPSVK